MPHHHPKFDPSETVANFAASAFLKGEMTQITLDDYVGRYVILLFFPMDETMDVTLQEVQDFSILQKRVRQEHNDLIIFGIISGLSIEKVGQYTEKNIEEGGLGGCNFPILCDETGKIADIFKVATRDAKILDRGMFVIGRHRHLRFKIIQDSRIARSAKTAEKILNSLRHTDGLRAQHGDLIQA